MLSLSEKQRELILRKILDDSYRDTEDLLDAILNDFDPVKTTKKLSDFISALQGDNLWVSDKALMFMQATLFPLLLLRDLGIFRDTKQIKHIKTFSDLQYTENMEFSFERLRDYMEIESMVDLVYALRALLKDNMFVTNLGSHKEYVGVNIEKHYLHMLVSILGDHGLDMSDENIKPNIGKLPPNHLKQFNYGVNPWKISIIGNQYYA